MNNKILHAIALILLIVGGLNWLLHALDWNLVDLIFTEGSTIAKGIYILVGLAAIYELLTHKRNCKLCATQSTVSSAPHV